MLQRLYRKLQTIIPRKTVIYVPSDIDFTIYDVIKGMQKISRSSNVKVTAYYKGLSFTILPFMTWEEAVALWNQTSERAIADTLNVSGGAFIGGSIEVDGVTIAGGGNVSTRRDEGSS